MLAPDESLPHQNSSPTLHSPRPKRFSQLEEFHVGEYESQHLIGYSSAPCCVTKAPVETTASANRAPSRKQG